MRGTILKNVSKGRSLPKENLKKMKGVRAMNLQLNKFQQFIEESQRCIQNHVKHLRESILQK